MTLAGALGASVAADAGSATGAAWSATVVAVVILSGGLLFARPAAVPGSLAVLTFVFLARSGDRLVMAVPYGAALVIVAELAHRSLELRTAQVIQRGAIARRLASTTLLVGMGACAAALVAMAATLAPARSVAITGAGAAAAGIAIAATAAIARRRRTGRPAREAD